jgi:hypothetical protein
MKKILILAYDFPPYSSVGSQRPYSYFMHFKKFGYEPIVVTRHWDVEIKKQEDTVKTTLNQNVTTEESELGTIIRVPYKSILRDRLMIKYGNKKYSFLRKALTFVQKAGQFYSSAFDPKFNIYIEADKYLSNHKVDFIIASGEPFILFRYTHLLSRKYGIPWVADYRDGWANNHTRAPSLMNSISERLELGRERKFLSNAAFLISVSDLLTKRISETVHVKGYSIPNAAELSLYKTRVVKDPTIFSAVYTGIFYDLNYVNIFIEAFEKFIKKYPSKNIQFVFVGITHAMNNSVVKILNLKDLYPDNIIILDRVSSEEAAMLQLKATVLLSFIAGSQAKGLIGAKTYGYAATKNPILVISNESGSDTEFFPGRDIQLFTFTADEAADVLESLYNKFLRGENITTSITDEEIFTISREYQVKRLAGLLNGIN